MDFFDTNVLVYTVDGNDPRRQAIARDAVRQALAGSAFTVSTQVLQEFYSVVVRRQMLDHAEAVALLRGWAHERVVSTTPELLWGALELRSRWQFSIWDALVVQAALSAGCTRLVTEDLHPGQRIGDLEVFNPFQAPASVHEPKAAYGARRKPARA